jgi:hypothetical protein
MLKLSMLKLSMLKSFVVVVSFVAIALPAAAQTAVPATVTFDDQAVGKAPAGFTVATTGRGAPAVWTVDKAPDGAAGNVVVQSSNDKSANRFPLLVYDGATAVDVDVSVRFRSISGADDQAAGLVWRYVDANNYYIVRANALEDNVVLYKVEKGRRIDLPVKGQGRTYGAKAPVPPKTWHTLSVTARGNLFTVTINGKQLYEVEDKTFIAAGKTGLWTKADSVMMFDDFSVTKMK